MSGRSLRVIYFAGSGDASESLRAFEQGRYNDTIGHVGYSDQVFRVCDELGVDLLSLCTSPRATDYGLRRLRIERRTDPLQGKAGLAYHLAHVAFAKQVTAEARQFRADVVIVGFEPYAFLLEPLRRSGVKIVQALHCVLWPEFRSRSRSLAALSPLLRRSYRRSFSAILSASHYITRQVDTLAGAEVPSVVEFLPTFRPEAYLGVKPADPAARPFRVMFVGRFEPNKGVYLLLDVARTLKRMGRQDVVIELCGNGSAFAEIEALVEREGLQDVYVMHGWCEAQRLKQLSERAHVYVVPTTSAFVEGFNHVTIEGLLAGRPVITSRVCPAVDYVSGGVQVVAPDSADAYLSAITELAERPALYERLRSYCPDAQRFLSPSDGFGAAVHHVLSALGAGRNPERRTVALSSAAS
jgi:glycosyltransferase involved in cell wall biosynthesis